VVDVGNLKNGSFFYQEMATSSEATTHMNFTSSHCASTLPGFGVVSEWHTSP